MGIVVSYPPTADLPKALEVGKGDVAHCRILVVWDNDPIREGPPDHITGAPTVLANNLSWNHVLNTRIEDTQTPALATSYYNQDLQVRDKRVSVLMDKKFDMIAGTDRSVRRFFMNKNWLAKKLKFLAGGGEPINQRLKIMFVSNRVAHECPFIYWDVKYQYNDP